MKKIIILMIFLLTGCYNYQELSDLAIVKGAAIDIENEEYILSYSINSKNEKSEEIILKGRGKTISDAISDMNLTSPKELYIGHMLVLIISEDVAKIGINKVTDYFFRNPMSKKTFQLAITKNKAEDVLKSISPIDDIYKNLTSESSLSTFVINTTLLSFLKLTKDPGIDPVINGIEISDNSIKITNLAIFKNDQFIEWTSNDISKGIAILYNQSDSIKISTECDYENVVFKMNDIKIEKYLSIDNRIHLKFKIKANTEIEEMTCNLNLKDKNDLKKLEEILNSKVKYILNQTIEKIKQNNIDSIGIGFYIYQNDFKNFLKFKDDYLNKLDVEFEIIPNILAHENSNEGVKTNE